MDITIHDTGKATVDRIEFPASATTRHAFARTRIYIGSDTITLFHGVEEDPLNTLAEAKKGKDNE